jgi:hypothetical protein
VASAFEARWPLAVNHWSSRDEITERKWSEDDGEQYQKRHFLKACRLGPLGVRLHSRPTVFDDSAVVGSVVPIGRGWSSMSDSEPDAPPKPSPSLGDTDARS